ncbi:MAG: hypothetical protein A4E65_03291 [Syntrophorhabdus sp. PtaU1.Bin153]|jgi:predicted ATPase|nr:MAG: hypothetical protein A4E65_03291 [Syntrophorhabdus sp. PtaU1.Bin153]
MDYKYSQVDKANLLWFPNDKTRATLLRMELQEGQLRGLNRFEMEFKYPVSVIAGKNGCGKSTILALGACGYHNNKDGFKLASRKFPYYTFSDFFLQTDEEVPPEGIRIGYHILFDRWKKTQDLPDGVGVGHQARIKKKGGKWNKYSRRVRRDVVFFGIERVVPHSEKSVSRSYRRAFAETDRQGWEGSVRKVVSKILGSSYDAFWHKEYGKYHLPMVKAHDTTYSGFNMGAGENALFEIFSTIFAWPKGTLVIIDEIELGLHEEAQTRLIAEMKEVCNERHIQVICTTHSMSIIKSVPPEARFFVERFEDKTVVTPGISPSFAGGKLAGENSNELDIFVEDGRAKNIVQSFLSHDIRTRVNVLPIGSAAAVVRQLAARYKDIKKGECLGILDGDKSTKLGQHHGLFIRELESPKNETLAREWINERLVALPGDSWPESWLLSQCEETADDQLADQLSTTKERLGEAIKKANLAGKHDELYALSHELGHDENGDFVCQTLCRHVAIKRPESFDHLRACIRNLLK